VKNLGIVIIQFCCKKGLAHHSYLDWGFADIMSHVCELEPELLQVNKVDFAVTGLGFIKGNLTINAVYRVDSPKRVLIDFQNASLVSALCLQQHGEALFILCYNMVKHCAFSATTW
jgi:hypothetical protein